MDPNVDIQKLAEKLARAGREAVAWELKKLQWILEEKRSQNAPAEKSTAA